MSKKPFIFLADFEYANWEWEEEPHICSFGSSLCCKHQWLFNNIYRVSFQSGNTNHIKVENKLKDKEKQNFNILMKYTALKSVLF